MSAWDEYGCASPWLRPFYSVARGLYLALDERVRGGFPTPGYNYYSPRYGDLSTTLDWPLLFDQRLLLLLPSEWSSIGAMYLNQFDGFSSFWTEAAMLSRLASAGFEPIPFLKEASPRLSAPLTAEWARQRYMMLNWLRYRSGVPLKAEKYEKSVNAPTLESAWAAFRADLDFEGATEIFNGNCMIHTHRGTEFSSVYARLNNPKGTKGDVLGFRVRAPIVEYKEQTFFDFGTGFVQGETRLVRLAADGFFWRMDKDYILALPLSAFLPSGIYKGFSVTFTVYAHDLSPGFTFFDDCDNINA